MKGTINLFDNNIDNKDNIKIKNKSNSLIISRSIYSKNRNQPQAKEEYNNVTGKELLKKVSSKEAQNFIKQHYRSNAKIGDGGTADAVKHELETGEKVGGKSHIKKAEEGIKFINNLLRKYPDHIDKKFFLREKKKLEKALKTPSKKGDKNNDM